MLIGYARVSTQDQNTALQEDALQKAGCELIYIEKASGAREDRPKLAEMLKHARQGDTIAVWRIDRLARSIKHLIEIAADLKARGSISGACAIPSTRRHPAARWSSTSWPPWRSLNAV